LAGIAVVCVKIKLIPPLRVIEDAAPLSEDEATLGHARATSFARDQRGSFTQNHDHECTATCVKYEKKQRDATELPQRCDQKISGPGVPK
jgi:hypothetical protein